MSTNEYEGQYYTSSRMSNQTQCIKTNNNYLTIKRYFDFVLAILLIIPFSTIILIFGFLVKLESKGSMFYTQLRVGLNGKIFKIYKLRSMSNDAEKNGIQWASIDDQRVTKVGKFIRRTRIDELPQIINVLKGEMSFIGPRPERPELILEFESKIPSFSDRLVVLPGVSGLAQVCGGYDLKPEEKLKYDIKYISNICFFLDCKILIKTIQVLLTGNGAR